MIREEHLPIGPRVALEVLRQSSAYDVSGRFVESLRCKEPVSDTNRDNWIGRLAESISPDARRDYDLQVEHTKQLSDAISNAGSGRPGLLESGAELFGLAFKELKVDPFCFTASENKRAADRREEYLSEIVSLAMERQEKSDQREMENASHDSRMEIRTCEPRTDSFLEKLRDEP
jgi:hypothetical protein